MLISIYRQIFISFRQTGTIKTDFIIEIVTVPNINKIGCFAYLSSNK